VLLHSSWQNQHGYLCQSGTDNFSGIILMRSNVDFLLLCLLYIAVDGVWTEWSQWNKCDVSCGNGTSARTRSCTNPPPAQGGNDCQGPSQEASECVLADCPGIAELEFMFSFYAITFLIITDSIVRLTL